MKKIISLALVIVLALCITACSNGTCSDATDADSTKETTTQRVEKTTAPPKEDEEKGAKLQAKLGEMFSTDVYKVGGGVRNGSFACELIESDPAEIYKNEADDQYKKVAEKNAAELVELIKDFYTDEIKFDCTETRIVGGEGDEGVDSALYEIKYYNTQNQELVAIADSSGQLVIVRCNFTW